MNYYYYIINFKFNFMIGQDYPHAGPAIRCVDKASG